MATTSNSRLKIDGINWKSLKQNNYENRDYLGLGSTLNDRTNFRIVKQEKVRKIDKLFSKTGGMQGSKNNRDADNNFDPDHSLSQLFEDYNIDT